MATLKEQDIVLTTKDADGNTVIQMPITRKENVEGLSEELLKCVRSVNGMSGEVVLPNEFNGDGVMTNPITATADDTTAKWKELGGGTYWFNQTDCLLNQPSQYGFLINYVASSDIFQLFKAQRDGQIYYRGGNANGWGAAWSPVGHVYGYYSTVSGSGSHSVTTGSALNKTYTFPTDKPFRVKALSTSVSWSSSGNGVTNHNYTCSCTLNGTTLFSDNWTVTNSSLSKSYTAFASGVEVLFPAGTELTLNITSSTAKYAHTCSWSISYEVVDTNI